MSKVNSHFKDYVVFKFDEKCNRITDTVQSKLSKEEAIELREKSGGKGIFLSRESVYKELKENELNSTK